MASENSLNNVVRSALRDQVKNEIPAASVRDSLLAEAARTRSRSAIGPSIPALANGLRESEENAEHGSLPNRQSVLSDKNETEKWLMMILPVYAIH